VSPGGLASNYVVKELVDIANLGLDDECDFSSQQYISLSDSILKKTKVSNTNRQLIAIYKAHYLTKIEKKTEAVELLTGTYALDKSNPMPLFLACEWLLDLDSGGLDVIRHDQCEVALEIAKLKAPKYSDFESSIRKRLGAH